MASISTSTTGARRILFMDQDGNRKQIRLGKVNQRLATRIKEKIEAIVDNRFAGCPLDGETVRWLAGISDELHKRMAAVGLVTPRENSSAKLGDFTSNYVSQRTDAKPQTVLNLEMFRDRLVAFFGADKPLGAIKRSDADAWVIYLKGIYAASTIGRTIKGARQFFKAAVRAEIIATNPFEGIKAGSHTDKDRQRFITHEEIQQVINACPDAQWRLIVALSRYGGLRCPSEHLALTWADVDWERSRFLVRSSKLEHLE